MLIVMAIYGYAYWIVYACEFAGMAHGASHGSFGKKTWKYLVNEDINELGF